jgi:hypothetical protein
MQPTALTAQPALETRFVGPEGHYLVHRVKTWSTGYTQVWVHYGNPLPLGYTLNDVEPHPTDAAPMSIIERL